MFWSPLLSSKLGGLAVQTLLGPLPKISNNSGEPCVTTKATVLGFVVASVAAVVALVVTPVAVVLGFVVAPVALMTSVNGQSFPSSL